MALGFREHMILSILFCPYLSHVISPVCLLFTLLCCICSNCHLGLNIKWVKPSFGACSRISTSLCSDDRSPVIALVIQIFILFHNH